MRTILKPNQKVTFAAYDGRNYDATITKRPRLGVVSLQYNVRGVGTATANVPTSRVIVATAIVA